MADERIIFSVDLDTKEASVKVSDLKKGLAGIGKESMGGAVDGLKSIAVAAGEAYAAFKTLETVWNSLFEADRLKAIDSSFQQLTKTFGLSGDALRSGLEKASNGLVDTTDLLQIANKALVAMGSEAQRLPEIMELARKASVVTGQSVAETFEQLTQAIATGNQRALKHMGIIVDVDNAYKDYSKSLGYTSDVLSEAGKQHALLNEVLKTGKTNLEGIDTEVQANTNTWLKLKSTLSDLRDFVTLTFEKVMGPKVRAFLDDVKFATQELKESLTAMFGEGAEGRSAKIKQLEKELGDVTEGVTNLKQQLVEIQSKQGNEGFWQQFFGQTAEELVPEKLAQIKEATERMGALEEQIKKLKGESASENVGKGILSGLEAAGAGAQAPQTDKDKVVEDDKKRAKELVDYQKQLADEALLAMQTDEDAREAILQRRLFYEAQTSEQIRMIGESKVLSDQQKSDLILAAEEALVVRRQDLANQLANYQVTAAENAANRSVLALNKFASGAELASKRASKAFLDFSALGQMAVNTFASATASAFQKVGEGSESLGDAMKHAVINSVADIAFAKGSELIASSIFPPNPLGFAAGAGLVALSGVLRRLAGGGSSPSIGSASAGGGAGGGGSTPIQSIASTPVERPTMESQAVPRKSVTLVVQGHYFETEQTRTKLTELIREASDATDFKILSVGGQV